MIGLPEWMGELSGFDRTGTWVPIVCTHGTSRYAEADVLGVAYEHAVTGELRWSGGTSLPESDDDVGIWVVQMWENRDTGERHVGNKGSMRIRCSRGCSPRIPAVRFAEWIAAANDAHIPLDVSRV